MTTDTPARPRFLPGTRTPVLTDDLAVDIARAWANDSMVIALMPGDTPRPMPLTVRDLAEPDSYVGSHFPDDLWEDARFELAVQFMAHMVLRGLVVHHGHDEAGHRAYRLVLP